ncbi:hypothetical protein TNCV_3302991 [Trichonephila clavipes]|nr:hypothetical protein TNCV_3302991 [Trichonephila clavipes]
MASKDPEVKLPPPPKHLGRCRKENGGKKYYVAENNLQISARARERAKTTSKQPCSTILCGRLQNAEKEERGQGI